MTPRPLAVVKGVAKAVTGMGGSSGRVARKVAWGAASTPPATPYTGALKSGTSSTYWYSSVHPEVAEMVAPPRLASVKPSVPQASVTLAASSTGA